MLQQDQPDDFVVATGVTTSVREMVQTAFNCLGVELEFSGQDSEEIGTIVKASNYDFNCKVGDVVVKKDPRYYRPTEVDLLIGDPSKAKEKLGWRPKYDFKDLINEMVLSDLNLFKKDLYLKKGGHEILNYNE